MNKLIYLFLIIVIVACAGACNNIDDTKLFSKMPSSKTGVKFKNLVTETDEFNILTYGNIYNGGGVAAGDVNNDGLIDLYFTGSMVGSRLYINQGDFEFEEIAQKAGVFAAGLWNTGTAMADINGDGFLDIYVCRSAAKDSEKRKNVLFINNGDLTFTDKSKEYGLDDSGYSTQSAFFDYDRDGDLDVFVLNHSVQPYSSLRTASQKLRQKKIGDYADRLYRNDNGRFVDVSDEAGIISSVLGFGLSITISDINKDLWPDIYISNDFHEHDFLYLNNGDGTFSESLKDYIGHTSHFSMGSDIADINNDQRADIITLDMLPEGNFRQKMVLGPDNYNKNDFLVKSGFHHQYMRNMLHLNTGNSFSEIGQFSGIHSTDWSWAPLLVDFDNNGLKDIFITNGVKRDYTNMDFMNFAVQKRLEQTELGVEPAIKDLLQNIPSTIEENYAYSNNGDLTFSKVTHEWGLGGKSLSNGAAYADLDNDGDYDLIVSNTDNEAFIYRNNQDLHTTNHFVKLQLKGSEKNTQALGSKVIAKLDSTTLYQELWPVRGFQSSVDPSIILGLGQHNIIRELQIIWPNGPTTVLKDIPADQTLVIEQKDSNGFYEPESEPVSKALLADITKDSLLTFAHKENKFDDFGREVLLPHKLSKQGPKLAVADVNGDRRTDIYIGGAKNQSGKLYLQNAKGRYIEKKSFNEHSASEDIGAVFFDANGDSRPDLFVSSGGNEEGEEHESYKDRLYINRGNGNFVYTPRLLPENAFSSSCVVPEDIDRDGDIDLFVGGRLVPGNYPLAPKSRVYLNDGSGKFTDATTEILGDQASMGMVTDAIWNDFNNDGKPDLVVVGEFMPIRFFANTENRLQETDVFGEKDKFTGWWNSIDPADIDGDGDTDFVVGNFGLNSQLKASAENPVTIYAKDFDKNGSIDPILCNYLDGKNYPAFSKDDMTTQLTFLKDKYPNYADYADQSITDIFGKETLEDAIKLEVQKFESVVLRNIGNGKFEVESLPLEAQLSPIYKSVPFDIDGDNDEDLLLFGNFFDTRVLYGRYDANHGLVLKNDGKGRFETVDQTATGMKIMGQVRDAHLIENTAHGKMLTVVQNDGPILLFRLQKN